MYPDAYLAPWDSYAGEIFVPPNYKRSLDVRKNNDFEGNSSQLMLFQENITSRPNSYYKYWHENTLTPKEDQNYYPRGRSLKFQELNHVDQDSRWNNIYAHKDRKELFEIIQSGYKK